MDFSTRGCLSPFQVLTSSAPDVKKAGTPIEELSYGLFDERHSPLVVPAIPETLVRVPFNNGRFSLITLL
jgi:hypothetical protein